MGMKRAKMKVSFKCLHEALKLPDDVAVVAVTPFSLSEFQRQRFEVALEGEGLPDACEHHERCQPLCVQPEYKGLYPPPVVTFGGWGGEMKWTTGTENGNDRS